VAVFLSGVIKIAFVGFFEERQNHVLVIKKCLLAFEALAAEAVAAIWWRASRKWRLAMGWT